MHSAREGVKMKLVTMHLAWWEPAPHLQPQGSLAEIQRVDFRLPPSVNSWLYTRLGRVVGC